MAGGWCGFESNTAYVVSFDRITKMKRFLLTKSRVPPNVQFEVDDVEGEWTYNTPFDLVHVRFMAASIVDWPKLVKQTFTSVLPQLPFRFWPSATENWDLFTNPHT